MALEARAPWEWGSALLAWPMLNMLGSWPRPSTKTGAPQHVIVYPGLAAGDTSTQPLRAFLKAAARETTLDGLTNVKSAKSAAHGR